MLFRSIDQKSTNWWLKGRVLFNATNGSKGTEDAPIEGVPTPFPWIYNSKGSFAAVGFARALGLEIKQGTEFNVAAAIGKEVDMFISNVLYEGTMKNATDGRFRAPRAA